MQSHCWKPVLSLLTVFLVSIVAIHGKQITEATEETCEVCVKFLGKFTESLDASIRENPKEIEKAFRKTCAKTKKDDNRFCYYVGGLEESATTMLGDIIKPISYHMPVDKICMKLYKRDGQICELKYDKQLDLTKVNLKKLKVKDLKEILSHWDEQCKGCTEKSDFIKLIEELMPKHAPDAHAARQKAEL